MKESKRDGVSPEMARRNVRTALILAAVAFGFFLIFVLTMKHQ